MPVARTAVVVAGALLLSAAAAAQPLPKETLPDPLKPWADWAPFGQETQLCPAVPGRTVCLWPGRLALEVADGGGRFSFDLYVDAALHVPLPGGAKAWPQSVTLDGREVPVLERSGA